MARMMKVPMEDVADGTEIWLNLDSIATIAISPDSSKAEKCFITTWVGGGMKLPAEYYDKIMSHLEKIHSVVPDAYHKAWESTKDGDDEEDEPDLVPA